MTCAICGKPAIAEHPDRGPLCRVHAIGIALIRARPDGAAARAALYEHAAVGRLTIQDHNGPEFALTPEGELWALEEIAAWAA